jgi:hypothetical protein
MNIIKPEEQADRMPVTVGTMNPAVVMAKGTGAAPFNVRDLKKELVVIVSM